MTDWISVTIDAAISAGVSAPTESPAGAYKRSSATGPRSARACSYDGAAPPLTAEPTLEAVREHADSGASGSRVSPISTRTCPISIPSASAAILAQDRVRALPMSWEPVCTRGLTVGADPYRRGCWALTRGIRRRRHAPTDEVPAVTHRARLRRASRPTEPLRAQLVARPQRLTRKRMPAFGVTLGVVPQAKLEGIDPDGIAELVHRRLEGKGAARLARRAREVGVGMSRRTSRWDVSMLGHA
jgi:hypothetical protein